jgi:hypothetical protein
MFDASDSAQTVGIRFSDHGRIYCMPRELAAEIGQSLIDVSSIYSGE